MTVKNVTNEDILSAINAFADDVEGRFKKVDGRFEKIEADITHIKAVMVTKEYLDEKLADLRGDLVVLTRKEDTKVRSLIDLCHPRLFFCHPGPRDSSLRSE